MIIVRVSEWIVNTEVGDDFGWSPMFERPGSFDVAGVVDRDGEIAADGEDGDF